MKKVWLLIAILAGLILGLLAGLILPAEWRAKLSRPLAVPIRHCLGQMPDD
jgi:Na+/H+-dicarboxylate symporter